MIGVNAPSDPLCGYWSARPEPELADRLRRTAGALTLLEAEHWAIAAPRDCLTAPSGETSTFGCRSALVGEAFTTNAGRGYRRLAPTESARLIAAATMRRSGDDRLPWGRWSAATVSPRGDQLTLTRDSQGLGCVFYTRVGEAYVFATRMDLLFRLVDAVPDPDWSFLSRLILARSPADEVTAFRGIRQVPPGSFVEFAAHTGPRQRTHWSPTGIVAAGLVEPDPDELRDILLGCVDAWVGDQSTVWLELSGGLDSSALAWAAHETGRTVKALNYCGATGDPGDERGYARRVCDYLGIELQVLRTDLPLPARLDRVPTTRSCSPGTRLAEPEVMLARENLVGEVPLLSGVGSDHLLHAVNATEVELHDYLVERGFGAWRREWLAVSRRWGRPLLPLAARTLAHEVARRRNRLPPFAAAREDANPPPPWLRTGDVGRSFPSRFSTQVITSLPAGKLDQLLDIEECREQLVRLQQTSSARYITPFYSEPLVELALAAPISSLCTARGNRLPLRAAMRGRIPETIVDRTDKGETSRPTLLRFARRLDELRPIALDGHAVAAGAVDRAKLSAEFDRAARGRTDNTVALTRLLEVEMWCRSWADHSGFADGRAP